MGNKPKEKQAAQVGRTIAGPENAKGQGERQLLS